jgi:CRP-like cAMP-binding protein
LLGVAASLGAFLSAGVINAAGGGVYRPRLKLLTPLPRFSVDTDDALLDGPDCAIDLAIARIAPVAALCAAAAAAAPSLSLPLFCGLLWSLAPLPGQPAYRMLRALHHTPPLTTSRGRAFAPNRRVLRRLRLLASRENLRFAGVLAGYTLPWLLLVAFTWMATTDQDPATLLLLFRAADWPRLALLGAAGLTAVAALAACGLGVASLAQTLAARRDERATGEAVRATRAQALPHASDVEEFLARTHPFQLVPSAKRDAAARSMQLLAFEPDDVLLAKGDARPRLYLLYSGEARTDSAGTRHSSASAFSAGCLFGEGGLLKNEPQASAVRATTPGVALILEHSAYLALVAPHVPAHKLTDAAQKVALLRQTALARNWPPHLLEGFARRAELLGFGHGEAILHEGQENLWFHLLVEGELHVLRKGQRLARIRAGEFFGEISLLQNGFAAADIVGHSPGRYLSVPKNDFLVFFAHDPAVAMQFEAVASRRLGRPVFPL